MKINKSLNVLKCLAAFAVVCIHCSLYTTGTVGTIIDAIIRFAVPVFFLISGYFSYFEDNEQAKSKYKTRIIRLIKLIIIANLLYFVYGIIMNKGYTDPTKLAEMFSAKNIFSYVILNLSPFSGHLWFLGALLYCYIIYFLMSKFNCSQKKMYKYIPVLLVANIMLGEVAYHMRIYNLSIYYRNFLFTGIPFFALGYLIRDKREFLEKNVSNKFVILTILVSCALISLERLATGKIDLNIGTIVLSTIIFIWCVINPDKLKFKVTGWIGEKLYTSIYIIQGIVIELLREYEKNLGLTNENACYINTICAFAITVLISIVIYNFNNIIKKLRKKDCTYERK